jgi:hypothetical protein
MRLHLFLFAAVALSACAPSPTVPAVVTQTPEPTRVVVPTAAPATLTVTATPSPTPSPTQTSALATATITQIPGPPPTTSSTPVTLLPPPQLAQPQTRASYAANQPVILSWTWERSLQPDDQGHLGEYFQVQLSREGNEPKDFGCITATTYVIAQPPLGYGGYPWRVLVRRGKIQGDSCTSQGDVSYPSEIRTFEWRVPPEPPSPVPPTPRPYP